MQGASTGFAVGFAPRVPGLKVEGECKHFRVCGARGGGSGVFRKVVPLST